MPKYIKQHSLLCSAAMALFVCMPVKSNSQTNTIASETIELAKDIEFLTDKNDVDKIKHNIVPLNELTILRQEVSKIISQEIDADLNLAIQTYNKTANQKGTQRDQEIGKILQDIINVIDHNNLDKNADTVINKIEPYKTHTDWFVASHAHIYSSLFHSYKRDYIIALQDANHALDLIPNVLNSAVSEAKLYATNIVAYLHNLQNNTELAVKTSQDLVDLHIHSGLEINGVSILNNLMYSVGNSRDHETGKELAQILLRLEEQTDNTTPGLTDLRVAEVYNELGKYDLALKHAQKTLKKTEITFFLQQAHTQSAIAYAGLGLTAPAIRELKKLGPRRSVKDLLSQPAPDGILYAEALIALSQGQGERAIRLMNRRLDVSVQEILNRNNRDTTNLLANLENNRARQEEREKSLKREADLKAAQLEAQKRITKLLILLAAILAISTTAAILFARYRSQISKELAIQTKAAQSADKMKSEFLGMVSHELRTPLNGIIGIADLLANHHKDPDIRQKTKIILDSGNDLTAIIESIIDMSHIEGGKLSIYADEVNPYEDIKAVIAIWEQQAIDKDLTFTAFMDETINQDMHIDIARFNQCLQNLLSNAVKFTQSGRIHVHMTAQVNDNQDMEIKTIIADTGQGITETVQAKLFTPFLQADSSMTRKHGGAGLNLAITQAIARMMGGDVSLVSNAGRGSEFTFTMKASLANISTQATDIGTDLLKPEAIAAAHEPLSSGDLEAIDIINAVSDSEDFNESLDEVLDESLEANLSENILDLMQPSKVSGQQPLHGAPLSYEPEYSAAAPLPHIETPTLQDLNGLKILIVEDMATNRDIIRLFLDSTGCICLEAESGQQALEVLQNHTVDIILMDIHMPIMDGIETTKIIRTTDNPHKNTPIIALTADSAAAINAQCLRVGMDIFLAKPIISADLTASILFLLNQRQHNPQRALAV